MAERSRIEWTDCTWNPVTGCSKISSGCAHCYAERMANRLKAMGSPNYRNGFAVQCHPELLARPAKWRRPRRVFVNSMGDLFHPEVPVDFVAQVFQTMAEADQHIYQVLTKRPAYMYEFSTTLEWPPHVWAGVTVESSHYLYRVAELRRVKAAVRFLSLEPLLGPVTDLALDGIHWVIVGGESGPGARTMQQRWVLDVRDRCLEAGVPFFFKQWGGVHRSARGRLLEGRVWDDLPGCHPIA